MPSQVLPPSPLREIVSRVREVHLPAMVAGHRGDSQNAPENTLRAFELAIAAGCHLIEMDVRTAGDGTVIVFHDERVDRTTDGHGEVSRMSIDQLKELSAGSWFGRAFADERIPTLDEFLDLCRGRTVPLIEIKDKRRKVPEVGAKICEALKHHGMSDQAIIICREEPVIPDIREAGGVPIAWLTVTKRQVRGVPKLAHGVDGVAPYWKSLSLSMIQQLRHAGYFLVPWTVDRPSDMERLLELGCEALISNSPALLFDSVEGFEFERTEELAERFLRGEEVDVDLELDEGIEGLSPEQVAFEVWEEAPDE